MAKDIYEKAIQKIYSKENWEELPSQETPVTAEAMDIIEAGIYANSINISKLGDSMENVSARVDALENDSEFLYSVENTTNGAMDSYVDVDSTTMILYKILGVEYFNGVYYILFHGFEKENSYIKHWFMCKTTDFDDWKTNGEFYFPSDLLKNLSDDVSNYHNYYSSAMLHQAYETLYITLPGTNGCLVSSKDGVAWTQEKYNDGTSDIAIEQAYAFSYGNNKVFFANGGVGVSTTALYIKEKGDSVFSVVSISRFGFATGMCYDGNTLVVRVSNGGVYYSTDLQTFTKSNAYFSNWYIANGNDIFLTVSSGNCYTSNDAVTWDSTVFNSDANYVSNIVFVNGMFYFEAYISNDGSYLFSTKDGKTFNQLVKLDDVTESIENAIYYISDDKFTVKYGDEANGLLLVEKLSKYVTQEELNRKGYLTEEQDPTVPDWAKQENKPTYTAEEIGALGEDSEMSYADIKSIWDATFNS